MRTENLNYLTLSQVARQCPSQPSPNTVWRWARRGVSGRNGQKIRLRHVRIGGKLYIPFDAVEEFFKAVAEADADYFADSPKAVLPSLTRSAAARERAVDAAEKALQQSGA